MFQPMINSLFQDAKFVHVHTDDVFIGSTRLGELTSHFIVISDRIGESGVKIKLEKCVLGGARVNMMGYVVSAAKVDRDTEKVKCVVYGRLLRNIKRELLYFLMSCLLNRRFVQGFYYISTPLKGVSWQEIQSRCRKEAKSHFNHKRR